jgi:hypothetical protein
MVQAVTSRLLTLRRFILEQVTGELAPRGFVFDLGRQMWLRPRSAAVHDMIGVPIDLQLSSPSLLVTANISVYSPKLLARLEGRKPDTVMHFASLTRNIGQIAPGARWRQWEIADDAERDWKLGAFLTMLVDTALPWQQQFQDLRSLCEGFVQFGHQDHSDWTVPTMLDMMNEESPPVPARRADRIEPIIVRGPRFRQLATTASRGAEPLWLCDE